MCVCVRERESERDKFLKSVKGLIGVHICIMELCKQDRFTTFFRKGGTGPLIKGIGGGCVLSVQKKQAGTESFASLARTSWVNELLGSDSFS